MQLDIVKMITITVICWPNQCQVGKNKVNFYEQLSETLEKWYKKLIIIRDANVDVDKSDNRFGKIIIIIIK